MHFPSVKTAIKINFTYLQIRKREVFHSESYPCNVFLQISCFHVVSSLEQESVAMISADNSRIMFLLRADKVSLC